MKESAVGMGTLEESVYMGGDQIVERMHERTAGLALTCICRLKIEI